MVLEEPLFPSRFHGKRINRCRANVIVPEVFKKAGFENQEASGLEPKHLKRSWAGSFDHLLASIVPRVGWRAVSIRRCLGDISFAVGPIPRSLRRGSLLPVTASPEQFSAKFQPQAFFLLTATGRTKRCGAAVT
jgi:hypothetical protein